MIKALQRRFIFTAMISLLVLLIILIAGITTISYIMMEHSANDTLGDVIIRTCSTSSSP